MSPRPPILAVAAWIYAAALVFYPRRLRRRYGSEMRQTFEAGCRDAGARGAAAVLAWHSYNSVGTAL